MNGTKNRKYDKSFFLGIALIITLAGILDSDTVLVEPGPTARISVTHEDIAIPNITLTDDIKAGMFLDQLTVDTSVLDPAAIMESIAPWNPYIELYAEKYDIDPDLVRAIIYTESKGKHDVVSRRGAQGLMQLMPVTVNSMGIMNPFDPEENIRAGVRYISWLIKYHSDDDEKHLLWAWNAGPGKFNRSIIPDETKKFIVEVLSVKTFLKEKEAMLPIYSKEFL
ncbi:lytic transglycosylase domain-containing protein [Candidatus Latescibacterota bacterium]